jgi:hypothetical protein
MLFQRSIDRLDDEDNMQQVAVPSWLSNLDPRVLRISTSALGILTTKAIYIHGYHHPLQLLLLHLLATLLWEIILWLFSQRIERTFDTQDYTLYELTRRGILWSRTGLKLCLRFGFGTAALFCEYQAIYRFKSLPALAMLLLPDWGLLVRLVRHTDIPVLRKTAVIFGCLLGVAMVLVFEYQLSEVELKLVMTTIFMAVASQLLRQEPDILEEDPIMRSSLSIVPVRDKVLLLPFVVVAAVVAIYLREDMIYTPPLSKMLLATLAVNTLAAVVTFQCSGLFFRQTEPLATFKCVEEDHTEDEVDPTHETITLQTVIALGSVLLDLTIGSSCSVSIWQYVGFWIALGTLAWTAHQSRPRHKYHTIAESQEYHLSDFDASGLHKRQRGIKLRRLVQVMFAVSCMLLAISPILFTHISAQHSPHWLLRTNNAA